MVGAHMCLYEPYFPCQVGSSLFLAAATFVRAPKFPLVTLYSVQAFCSFLTSCISALANSIILVCYTITFLRLLTRFVIIYISIVLAVGLGLIVLAAMLPWRIIAGLYLLCIGCVVLLSFSLPCS
jgi:hypothetical protein